MIRKTSVLAVLLAAVALLASCGGASGTADGGGAKVVTPDVVGTRMRSASRSLVGADLRWRIAGIEEIHDRALPAAPEDEFVTPALADDLVLAQEPKAGERVGARTVVELETRCSRAAARGRPCR